VPDRLTDAKSNDLAFKCSAYNSLVITCLTAGHDIPGLNPTVGSSCVYRSDIQRWHGLLAHTAVGKSTQLSTIRGMAK